MDELDAFLDAIEDAGFEYFIGAAFREYSFQTHLFNSKASQIAYEMGLSADYLDPKYQEAVEKAKTIVMYPGSLASRSTFLTRTVQDLCTVK